MAENYVLQTINPMEVAMRGFQGIQALRQSQQQNALLAAQEQAAQAQAMKVQQEVQAAQRFQQDMVTLYNQFETGEVKPQDILRVIGANPQLSEPIQKLVGQMTSNQKATEFQAANDLFTAIELNDAPRVEAIINRNIAAAENAGDTDQASQERALLKLYQQDPKAAGLNMAFRMAVLDDTGERFTKQLEAIQTYRLAPGEIAKQQGELAQQAAELGLTKATTQKVLADAAAGSIAAATARINLERARAGGDPAVMTEEQFKAEKDLRGEVTKYTSSRTNARTALTNMRIAAGQNTGSGDIVLVTTFRKMIDEGSVVRETEAAQSEAAQSLLGRAQSLIDQINRGTRLSPQVRRDILAVSESIARQVEVIANDRLAPVRQTIRDYGLEPTRVFGASDVAPPAPVAPAAPAAPAAAPAAPRSQAAQIRARGGNRLPPQQTAPERPRVVNVQPRPKT